jgi:hypothetical protein
MLSAIVAGAMLAGSSGVDVKTQGARTELSLHGNSFHSTLQRVSHLRTLDLAGGAVVALWSESGKNHYAVSLDGETVRRVAEAKTTLDFQYQPFDPKVRIPSLPDALKARPGNELFVVQFETQALDAYREAIRGAGGTIVSYIPNNAYVVRMDESAKAAIEGMGFVRYVGAYEPAFRIDPRVSSRIVSGVHSTARYSILLTSKEHDAKAVAARMIQAVGGSINDATPGGRLIEATLTPAQVLAVANMNNVLWIDPWSPYTQDMNIARLFHGTNALETATGFTGQGVIGMVRDGGLRSTHVDFQTPPAIILSNSGDTSHGTSTYGIIFADGQANAMGRGVLPDAQGVFRSGLATGAARWNETNSAVQNQHVVFESNSTGSSLVTTYGAESANMDDIIFDLNVLICQSQSNSGTQLSRPQAWAKNIVSVGGIVHHNTETMADDNWGGASIGPAADGRLKPDLASFYDQVFCTTNTSNTAYTPSFSGTSSATPITCGHFGLLFQMWGEGIFNNTAYGNDVFGSKCSAMTAKAMMINAARQWTFTGTGHNLSRYKQGWGQAKVDQLYNLRNKGFVVDQTDVLSELGAKSYRMWVAPGETAFKATMCYRDLPGNPSVQTQHRVNDLTLRVVAPDGTVYWGNNGLAAGMWSTSGGSANTKDTVENVFVQNPASGVWTVEVSAPELNGDSHPETPGVEDADYALVVTGVSGGMNLDTMSEQLEKGVIAGGSIVDTHLSDNDKFSVRPGPVLGQSESPVRIIKLVMAPTPAVGDLWVSAEASVSDVNVDSRIEVWNFNTNSYDVIGTKTDMSSTDKVHTVFIANPANYVEAAGHIQVRVSYRASGPTFSNPWTANVDHIRVYFQP